MALLALDVPQHTPMLPQVFLSDAWYWVFRSMGMGLMKLRNYWIIVILSLWILYRVVGIVRHKFLKELKLVNGSTAVTRSPANVGFVLDKPEEGGSGGGNQGGGSGGGSGDDGDQGENPLG